MPRSSFVYLAVLMLAASEAGAQSSLPRIAANDNRVPAGTLANGILTVRLNVVRAMWHPDADTDPGVDILAFQEEGRPPSIPAPLIRVPAGTQIRATVKNTLSDSAIVITGLSDARTRADTVRIQPGEARELITHATTPGTYLYTGSTSVRTSRFGDDRQLAGAFVVDAAGEPSNDRVLVLLQWMDSVRLKEYPGTSAEVLTINGKTWPHTERLNYTLGDTIRWRVVNGSFDVHPMHLHGAYYTVLSRGDLSTDTIYSYAQRRQGVTERLRPQTTMRMEWAPERAGNWLFHCHLNFHIMLHPPLGELKASGHDTQHGMGGLAIGTSVHGPVARDAVARRQLRLVVQQYDSIPGDYVPPFSYRFDEEKKLGAPGPVIAVQKNEPIAITVVNRAKDPTSVHWHGLEIESYYDGVPGFGGNPGRTTPLVAAGDSFVVKMTPPRAGTYIYHSHADEARQQKGGLYGAFVVLEPGQRWDDEHERVIVISTPRDSTPPLINGQVQPMLTFKAGKTYRLRLINITLAGPNLNVAILDGTKQLDWKLIAKDGADLPAHQTDLRASRLYISIGETYDALFTPSAPGEYQLELRSGGGVLLRSAVLRIEP